MESVTREIEEKVNVLLAVPVEVLHIRSVRLAAVTTKHAANTESKRKEMKNFFNSF